MARISIIGLGVIGGSLGLALKQSRLKDAEIIGFARTRDTREKARKAGAIDVAAQDAASAVRDAEVVILAMPILAMRKVMAEIAPALQEGCIVTDVASTKAKVLKWAEELLPSHVHFVGGHPMAGKEQTGFDAAEAGLFEGKPYVIVPSLTATDTAIGSIVGIAELVGAAPLYMDAQEHDSYVAGISHLPLVVSTALFSLARDSAAWPELSQLASSGFRDTTRLASGSPDMSTDISVTNRENVVHWLDRFIQELMKYRDLISGEDEEALFKAFARIQFERDTHVTAGPKQRERGAAVPDEAKISLTDLLVGQWATRRSREIMKALEEDKEGEERQRRRED